jgi:hypothetical protein
MMGSKTRNEETWVPVLEKAYAKIHGSFESICSGSISLALEDLTGGVSFYYMINTDNKDTVKETLLHFDKGSLAACSLIATNPSQVGVMQPNGLIPSLAYGIIKVHEVFNGPLLIQMRNSWGFGEWNGAWSDGSKEWTPNLKKQLGQTDEDDGTFWMCYEDFMTELSVFSVCELYDDTYAMTAAVMDFDPKRNQIFQVKLFEKTKFTLMLSQPDQRFLRGLDEYETPVRFGILYDPVIPQTFKYADEDLKGIFSGYFNRRNYSFDCNMAPFHHNDGYHTIVVQSPESMQFTLRVYSKSKVEVRVAEIKNGKLIPLAKKDPDSTLVTRFALNCDANAKPQPKPGSKLKVGGSATKSKAAPVSAAKKSAPKTAPAKKKAVVVEEVEEEEYYEEEEGYGEEEEYYGEEGEEEYYGEEEEYGEEEYE